jgi:hypothetical protein
MSFFVRHRYGGDEPDPPFVAFGDLLDEVDEDPTDIEHVGVAVVHESEWCVGVYSGWKVVIEHLEDLEVEPRHIVAGGDREYVLGLMRAAAEGDLDLLERQPWKSGYGSAGDT